MGLDVSLIMRAQHKHVARALVGGAQASLTQLSKRCYKITKMCWVHEQNLVLTKVIHNIHNPPNSCVFLCLLNLFFYFLALKAGTHADMS